MSTRIAIFDPGLSGRKGHHFDQDLRLAAALTRLGAKVVVHADRAVDLGLFAAFEAAGAQLVPSFLANSYSKPPGGEDTQDAWRGVAATLREDLGRVATFDIGFWPSLTPAQLVALAYHPTDATMICALDGHVNWFSRHGAEMMNQVAEDPRSRVAALQLASYDRGLAELYPQYLGGFPIRRLPVPYDGGDAPPASPVLRDVGLFGHQRLERGLKILPQVTRALLGSGLKVTVQDSGGFVTADHPPDGLRILGFVDDFPRMLAATDLVVWPSRAEQYVYRTSGVVWQAIASGRPIVMPSGCRPAFIARERESAVFYHRQEPDAILAAVARARDRFPELAAAARRGAALWAQEEGIERLASALATCTLCAWDDPPGALGVSSHGPRPIDRIREHSA